MELRNDQIKSVSLIMGHPVIKYAIKNDAIKYAFINYVINKKINMFPNTPPQLMLDVSCLLIGYVRWLISILIGVEAYWSIKGCWVRLFGGTVPPNNFLFSRTCTAK